MNNENGYCIKLITVTLDQLHWQQKNLIRLNEKQQLGGFVAK